MRYNNNYFVAEDIKTKKISYGFFSKEGGCSKDNYDSLYDASNDLFELLYIIIKYVLIWWILFYHLQVKENKLRQTLNIVIRPRKCLLAHYGQKEN